MSGCLTAQSSMRERPGWTAALSVGQQDLLHGCTACLLAVYEGTCYFL